MSVIIIKNTNIYYNHFYFFLEAIKSNSPMVSFSISLMKWLGAFIYYL